MSILVTGGAGFIGSHVTDLLINQDYQVAIIDNISTGLKKNINPKANFYYEDLANYKRIQEIFEKEKPEIIFHLAAQINLRKSVEKPILDAKENILNSLYLLELARKYDTEKFVFSSTGGAIYGDTEDVPTTEKHAESPCSPYGCAKLAIEKYLNFYNETYGLKHTILRYSNVYGPRQNPHGEAGVIAIFFDNMFSGKSPVIFGGLQTRDFVFIEDVVQANLLAMKDEKNEIYNVGTGTETDIIEIFNKINRFFKEKFKAEYRGKKKGEQQKSCLSYEKIKENLGWVPKTSLEEGLNKTYSWYLKNYNC